MTRAFVALDLPDPALDLLETFQSEIPVGRLMTRETLHLTLAFLGDQSMDQLEELHHGLAEIHFPEFFLQLAGAEVYGGKRRQALAVQVEDDGMLKELHRQVAKAVRAAGMELERRRFRPHITVARLKGEEIEAEAARVAAFLEVAGGFRPALFGVNRFALYQSHLSPDGAVHDVLSSFDLIETGASTEEVE